MGKHVNWEIEMTIEKQNFLKHKTINIAKDEK